MKAFLPKELPIDICDKNSLIRILKLETEASIKIERFNTMIERSPIKESILLMFGIKESVESSRIEGTQATLAEVVEANASGNVNVEIVEVLNYKMALNQGEVLLETMPISTRMFHELHKTILRGSRGQNRDPGNYRKTQNFIRPSNDIKEASYIPPEHIHVTKYMSNLEEYINDLYDDDLGPISRAAVIHGQFETIHPYLDGNGRLGRILIVLYLMDKKVINNPSFFLSEELEKNKFKYYKLLNDLRKDDAEWEEWIIFFINSAKNQAENYILKLEKIENLYNDFMSIIEELKISSKCIDYIFKNPTYKISQMAKEIGVSYNTARKYTKNLEDKDLIYGDDKIRNRLYYNYELINIL